MGSLMAFTRCARLLYALAEGHRAMVCAALAFVWLIGPNRGVIDAHSPYEWGTASDLRPGPLRRRRLSSLLGVKQFPTSNQAWRRIAALWLIEHPQYESRFPKL